MSEIVAPTTGRNRGGWSKKLLAYLEQVQEVLTSLKEHWPLTLRQVYYQLVAAGTIENTRRAYGKLSRVLVKARLDSRVPWDAIEDRSRAVLEPSFTWADRREFAGAHVENFLWGYRRDLLQGQPKAFEVWVEKDALSRLCEKAAMPYQVPVVVARGFSSVSYVHDCAQRVRFNWRKHERQTVVLYFGDLDPSGWAMLPTMMETLQAEMALGDMIVGKRCALTVEQVDEYDLPRDPDALKPTDTRAKKYMEQFGDLAVELDALPPDVLQGLVEEAIREELDLSDFEWQGKVQEGERKSLEAIREGVVDALEEALH